MTNQPLSGSDVITKRRDTGKYTSGYRIENRKREMLGRSSRGADGHRNSPNVQSQAKKNSMKNTVSKRNGSSTCQVGTGEWLASVAASRPMSSKNNIAPMNGTNS